ncbi:MAG: alpha-mannosidase [Propylenella sp.]
MGYLNLEHRLRRVRKRVAELEWWVARRTLPLDGWTVDGKPHGLGQPWPGLGGVFAFAHPPVDVPDGWPVERTRLRLDLGGEGLLAVGGPDGVESRYGLDPYHTSFPVPGRRFSITADCVARLPFGVPNRAARLARAEIAWIETDLEQFILLLTQVAELAQVLGGYAVDQIPLEGYHPYRPHPDHSRPHDVVAPLISAAEEALHQLRWPSDTTNYIARTAPSPDQQSIWQLPADLAADPEPLSADAVASVVEARDMLVASLRRLRDRYPQAGSIALSGHAHTDLAWLWPLEETRRKAVRTFHTAVDLMDRFPDYRFNQSTAQYYAWLEEDDPALLARIKEKVAAGQWEPIGAMWVEPDTNMPTGESFVRQLLYGIRYFDKAFGRERRTTVNWLPDCFGFSPALPQLLRLAGLDSFFTHKTNWSERNKLPSDLFWWEGLDGSRVLMHTFDNPAGGYNAWIGPRAAVETWRNYQDKENNPETLLLFGWGDGGGGPTENMLQRIGQLADFPAMPAVRYVNVAEWFGDIATRARETASLPVWVGEIYLEYHRGTLTTQGRTKFLHRRAERALITAETLSSMAAVLGAPFASSLEGHWRVLLRNQFHDILPGSSIREVYEQAETELAGVVAAGAAAQNAHLDEIARRVGKSGAGTGLLVVNPDLSPRPLRVISEEELPGGQKVDGGTVIAMDRTVPGLSAVLIGGDGLGAPGDLAVAADFLENRFVRVEFLHDGTLSSVFDKLAGRDCLVGRGNQIRAYVDKPRLFDAWDIEEDYTAQSEEVVASGRVEIVERGPYRAAIRIERKFRDSTITQTIRLWANSPRIDFKTDIDWHDRRILLKAIFPIAIRAETAIFECAHGIVRRPTHRNTPWDQAKFEVAAHRFVDMAEHGYGVALLNDGKYGHHALGNEVGVSLLRSPVNPDPLADEGFQSFTYALLPHSGDWLTGGVLAEAEDLNQPLLHRPVKADRGATWSALKIEGIALGLSALKPAEDGGSLIFRAYEPAGARGTASVTLPTGWEIDEELDLHEERSGPADLEFTPFQLHSWRLRRGA